MLPGGCHERRYAHAEGHTDLSLDELLQLAEIRLMLTQQAQAEALQPLYTETISRMQCLETTAEQASETPHMHHAKGIDRTIPCCSAAQTNMSELLSQLGLVRSFPGIECSVGDKCLS